MGFLDSVGKLLSTITGKSSTSSTPAPPPQPTPQATTQSAPQPTAQTTSAPQKQMSNDDILYKTAYDKMIGAQTQDQINDARNAIFALKGTAGEFGIGEFSKQLDGKQQALTNASAFNQQAEQAKMAEYLKQQQEAYKAQQKAILDANLAQNLAQLEQAYAQAVSDGQMSIRQAETDFATNKAQLEKQAYQNAQKTSLYGQELGIENSQQQVGLMQGDQARAVSLNNENKTGRDKRVADIQDRLSAITKQKNLDVANAQAQYNAGILQANSEASLNYSNNMFGMMKDSYNANLQQSFTEKNMANQQNYDLARMAQAQDYDLKKMATQQGYNLETMEKQFGFNMKELQESSRLRINEMTKAHGFDLEKMGVQLQNDIKMENIRYGHQSSLQGQAHQNALAEANAKFQQQARLVQQEAEAEKAKLASAYLDKNSTEYKIRMAQIDEATQIKTADIYATTKAEAKIKSILTDPALNNPVSKPKDNGLLNGITGYNKKMSEYNAYQEALARYNDLMK